MTATLSLVAFNDGTLTTHDCAALPAVAPHATPPPLVAALAWDLATLPAGAIAFGRGAAGGPVECVLFTCWEPGLAAALWAALYGHLSWLAGAFPAEPPSFDLPLDPPPAPWAVAYLLPFAGDAARRLLGAPDAVAALACGLARHEGAG